MKTKIKFSHFLTVLFLIPSICIFSISLNDKKNVHKTSLISQEKQQSTEEILIDTFDLALIIHSIDFQTQYVVPGHQVTFYIDVMNQGNISAQNIVIQDYIPPELTLNDSNWTSATPNRAFYTIAGPLTPGQMETIEITFDISSPLEGNSNLVNWAEIGMTEDLDGNINPVDIDSTPDIDKSNDIYTTNNYVDGNANVGEDEDDHDPTQIIVLPFDLALNIVLAPNESVYVAPNGFVTYRVNIFNQGQFDASNIEITDYIPDGLTLTDADWSLSDNKATYIIQDVLLAGASTFVDITFQLDSGLGPHTRITNTAEISSTTDDLGNSQIDYDSTPDNYSDNDTFIQNNQLDGDGKNGGDEDDHDIENIFTYSFDLALKVIPIYPNGLVYPGDTLIDRVFIYNQGQIDATNIEITEYLTSEFQVLDTTWLTNGAKAQIHLIDTLAPGDSIILDVSIKTNPNIATCETFEHWVEISNYNALSSVYLTDYDSVADTINNNDVFLGDNNINGSTLFNGDEDDHDKSSLLINQHILYLQDEYLLNCDQPILELCYTPYLDSSEFIFLFWIDNNGTSNNDTCIQITAAGDYELRYLNGNSSCYDFNKFTIIDYTSEFNIRDSILDISCPGIADGSITLKVNNNNANYTINWSSNDTTFTIDNLPEGIYTASITDSLGCVEEVNYTITEPDVLQSTSAIIVDDQDDDSIGSISLNVEGGTQPYEVTLEDGVSSTQNLGAGTYNCLVTDANGCTQLFGPYVLNNIVDIHQIVDSTTWSITPNPFNNEINIITRDLEENKIIVEIINIQGKTIQKEAIQKYKSDITLNTSSLDLGLYFIKIITPNGQFIHKMIKAE